MTHIVIKSESNYNIIQHLKLTHSYDIPENEVIYYHKYNLNGCIIDTYLIGDYIIINDNMIHYNSFYFRNKVESVDKPFVDIQPIGNAFHKRVSVNNYYKCYGPPPPSRTDWDYYSDYYNTKYKTIYLKANVIFGNETREVEFRLKNPTYGKVNINSLSDLTFQVNADFCGLNLVWDYSLANTSHYDADINPIDKASYAIKYYSIDNPDIIWNMTFNNYDLNKVDSKGIRSIESKKTIKPNLDKLQIEYPILFKLYQVLHSSKTSGGVSNNQLLSSWLQDVGEDYDKIVIDLNKIKEYILSNESIDSTRKLCLLFDQAKEKDRERREAKEWYLKKTNAGKAEGLGCYSKDFPKTFAAVEAGNLPFSLFHDPKDQLKEVNTEWPLWEQSLNRPGWAEVLFRIAADASRRSTYEKDLTAFLAFLFKIESYLDKHAPRPKNGKKKTGWKAVPKYVESQWQLEMEEADENGTVKKRSALTPVVDNEKGIIEVPYAAIATYGRQTTYCYSRFYFVLESGMLDYETETPIYKDLEEKLNGRDDYGLMYYTLTGSPTNRGYPTFLIIFERRTDYTHVHFHRVHPNKYKDGRPVPASRLIQECYRYMAGNVRAEEICAQQGDLIFIRSDEPKGWVESEMKRIKDFESHSFVSNTTVLLQDNKSKTIKNRLGFILAKEDFNVEHPEHEHLKNMSSGWYEIRRCKSWEANPTAIWSYTID